MWKKLDFKGLPKAVSGEGMTQQEEWQRFVEGFDFFGLIDAWRDLVGEMLARDTLPLKLKNRTLFILARHPAIAANMKYAEQVLLQKIHQRFPPTQKMLERIAFEANEVFFQEKARPFLKPRAPELHRHSPEYKRLRLAAEKLFQEITDLEERERWISLYIQSCQTDDSHST